MNTIEYQGISTATFVLWAGLPVLVLPTDKNAGRASASMLLTLGRAPLSTHIA